MPSRHWSKIAGIAVGILAGVALALRGAAEARRLEITRLDVPFPGLPDAFAGLRILHLSDFHLRPGTSLELVARLLALAEAEAPDVVCLTGDYLATRASLPDVARLLVGLGPRPVFAVFGNTDYRCAVTAEARAVWASAATFLVNRAAPLLRDGSPLWFAGVDDPHIGRDDLPTALSFVPPDAPVLLLAHSPEIVSRPIPPQVRLILSGHTHGGQICLPDGRALYLNGRLPRALASGLHRVGDALLFVTRGVGASRLPLRYNCPPEAAILTLRPA